MKPFQAWIYALPALPLALPTLVLFIYLPTLYFEEFGLSLGQIALILLLVRLSDLVSDPLVGTVNDKLGSTGQRVMISLGAVLCGLALYHTTHPTTGWEGLSLALSLGFLYLGWTMIQIPYLALLPMLTSQHQERTSITSLREGLGLIGLLLSAAIPLLLIQGGASTLTAMQQLSTGTLIIGAVSLPALLLALPWPMRKDRSTAIQLASIFRNRPARQLMRAWFSNGLANGIPAVLFPLYITVVLGLDESDRARFILIYFCAALLSIPLWWMASRQINRIQLWQGAMLTATLAFIPAAFLGPGDQSLFTLICVVTGLMLGADLALPHAMQADVCDWHRYRYKQDLSGLLYAVWNMFTKLALALAGLIAFGLLELSGFDSSDDESPVLPLIYALIPCVFKLIAISSLNRFPLNESAQAEIVRRLNMGDKV